MTPARWLPAMLALGVIVLGSARAQTPPAKASADSSPAAESFSIESEMLTYRALESNSKAGDKDRSSSFRSEHICELSNLAR